MGLVFTRSPDIAYLEVDDDLGIANGKGPHWVSANIKTDLVDNGNIASRGRATSNSNRDFANIFQAGDTFVPISESGKMESQFRNISNVNTAPFTTNKILANTWGLVIGGCNLVDCHIQLDGGAIAVITHAASGATGDILGADPRWTFGRDADSNQNSGSNFILDNIAVFSGSEPSASDRQKLIDGYAPDQLDQAPLLYIAPNDASEITLNKGSLTDTITINNLFSGTSSGVTYTADSPVLLSFSTGEQRALTLQRFDAVSSTNIVPSTRDLSIVAFGGSVDSYAATVDLTVNRFSAASYISSVTGWPEDVNIITDMSLEPSYDTFADRSDNMPVCGTDPSSEFAGEQLCAGADGALFKADNTNGRVSTGIMMLKGTYVNFILDPTNTNHANRVDLWGDATAGNAVNENYIPPESTTRLRGKQRCLISIGNKMLGFISDGLGSEPDPNHGSGIDAYRQNTLYISDDYNGSTEQFDVRKTAFVIHSGYLGDATLPNSATRQAVPNDEASPGYVAAPDDPNGTRTPGIYMPSAVGLLETGEGMLDNPEPDMVYGYAIGLDYYAENSGHNQLPRDFSVMKRSAGSNVGKVWLFQVPKADLLLGDSSNARWLVGKAGKNPVWGDPADFDDTTVDKYAIMEDAEGFGWNLRVQYVEGYGILFITEHTETFKGNIKIRQATMPWGDYSVVGEWREDNSTRWGANIPTFLNDLRTFYIGVSVKWSKELGYNKLRLAGSGIGDRDELDLFEMSMQTINVGLTRDLTVNRFDAYLNPLYSDGRALTVERFDAIASDIEVPATRDLTVGRFDAYLNPLYSEGRALTIERFDATGGGVSVPATRDLNVSRFDAYLNPIYSNFKDLEIKRFDGMVLVSGVEIAENRALTIVRFDAVVPSFGEDGDLRVLTISRFDATVLPSGDIGETRSLTIEAFNGYTILTAVTRVLQISKFSASVTPSTSVASVAPVRLVIKQKTVSLRFHSG